MARRLSWISWTQLDRFEILMYVKMVKISIVRYTCWYVPLVYILVVMLLQLGTILLRCAQVEFTAMREQYMRCGEGFMICYSVTDRHSFQETMEYRKLISRVRANEDIPLVLVGNKYDLQQQRKVYWIMRCQDVYSMQKYGGFFRYFFYIWKHQEIFMESIF